MKQEINWSILWTDGFFLLIQRDANVKEMLAFFPELLSIDEPLLKEDWTQFNEDFFELPFEGVTRHSHPNVISILIYFIHIWNLDYETLNLTQWAFLSLISH